jgi:hypothetical protein
MGLCFHFAEIMKLCQHSPKLWRWFLIFTKIVEVFLNFCQNHEVLFCQSYGIVLKFVWIMESTLIFPKLWGLWFSFGKNMEFY